jgi:CHAT domain-containing protein/tetratricopeptide (TPR) repeat protein
MTRACFSPLLALFAIGCAVGAPRPPALASAPAPAPLPPLPTVERAAIVDLAAGESHRYRLEAAPDRWLSIELWQRETDLDLLVLDAAGAQIASATTAGNWSDEVVDLPTGQGGTLIVEVRPAEEHPGTYRLRLAEDRPARPDDLVRLLLRRELRDLDRRQDQELEPQRAVSEFRRLLGEPRVDWLPEERAEIALHLGDALVDAEALGEADAAYRAGLEALPEPPSGAIAADLHRGLGGTALQERRFADADHELTRAIEIAEAAEASAVLGSALGDRASSLFDQRQIEAAIEASSAAVAAMGAAGDFQQEATMRVNLATLLTARGDRTAAQAELERARALAVAARANDPMLRSNLPLMLGVQYRTNGDVERARESFEAALAAAVETRNGWGEMHVRLHLGALLNQLGAPAEARRFLLRAAEIAETDGNVSDRAAASIHIAWADIGEGDHSAARDRLRRTLSAAGGVAEGPALRVDLEITLLHALGTAEIATGDHPEAQAHLTRAIELADAKRVKLIASDLRRALAELHLATGDLAAASVAAGEAAARAEEVADPQRQAAAASLLARLAAESGRPAEALERVLHAIALREDVRSRIVDPSLRASFLARWRSDFDLAIEMLMRLSQVGDAQRHLRSAFRLSEAAHARTLTELLAEPRFKIERGVDPVLLAAAHEAGRRLSQVQNELTTALAAETPAERVAELEAQRWQAHREVEAVDNDIRRHHPAYADLHRPRLPEVEEVQAWLPEGTTLLEYAIGERSSVLFVVTRDRFAALPLPAAEEIRGRVAAIRDLLGAPPLARGRLAAEIADATRLLLAPAAGHLAGAERLLVVPDRDLFHLPFEVLADPDDARAAPGGALRRWTITYLPSAAVLAHFTAKRAKPPGPDEQEVVLFADPGALPAPVTEALRGAGGGLLVPPGGLAALPGARREAMRIAALFPDRTQLFVGDAAREHLLKTPGALPAARRLHIASHGYISDADPAASYILLAAGGGDDGLLQIHEVFNLPHAPELVVLSGCETALGQRVEGEGLLGLARGFLYAGARDLVVSLRPVSDAGTVELMVDLYRHIREGARPDEALREAKLAALDAGAPPAVWSSFVVFAAPPAEGDSQ